jgi:hypothetical protein
MKCYCENEECRNTLPTHPLVLQKRYWDEHGRIRQVEFGFCSWGCVEVVAAKSKELAWRPDAVRTSDAGRAA